MIKELFSIKQQQCNISRDCSFKNDTTETLRCFGYVSDCCLKLSDLEPKLVELKQTGTGQNEVKKGKKKTNYSEIK